MAEDRKQAAEEWNKWRPGSGRKGWSPFTKPPPPMRDKYGRPMKNYDEVDWVKLEEEIRQGKWPK